MKILFVALLTADLDSTEHFYSEKLRLTPCYKDTETIRYDIGQSQLSFKLTRTLQPIYHIAFNIPNNMLAEAIEWLSEKVSLIAAEKEEVIVHFPNWNAESIYFYDEQKNILEFIARAEVKSQLEGNFSAASILNISEVGMPSNNVTQLATTLIEDYGLDHYAKQPPLPNFCALGDEEGLMILSSDDRNWFPTDINAKKFPIEIKFEVNGNFHNLSYQ